MTSSNSTVALLGRPNVGKSTLFNRFIQSRQAIVENTPGVTRDRNYGEVEWSGYTFNLVDTGGLLPLSDEVFERAIRAQAEFAMEEADVILFMVDAQTGVTPIDHEIVQFVRRASKPIILIVNKSDNDRIAAQGMEFWELGVGEPSMVSAANGSGTGDLLDRIIEHLPDPGTFPQDDERLKLAMIGRPNVGKSSITNALLGVDRSIVTDIPGTTRDSVDSLLKFHGREIVLVDTAGLRRRKKVNEAIEVYSAVRTMKAIDRCDVAVLVVDAERGFDRQEGRILTEAADRRKGMVIVVNKWDLVEKETNTAAEYTKKIYERIPMLSYVPVIFVSAITRQRLVKIIEVAESVNAERNKRIPTHDLNETILGAIADHPPPAVQGKDLRINYIVQPQAAPPVFLCFTNHPELVPENYTRYLENVLRRAYGFLGTPLTIVYKQKNRLRAQEQSARTI